MRRTASSFSASAARPYTVSVGSPTSPPRRSTATAAAMLSGEVTSIGATGLQWRSVAHNKRLAGRVDGRAALRRAESHAGPGADSLRLARSARRPGAAEPPVRAGGDPRANRRARSGRTHRRPGPDRAGALALGVRAHRARGRTVLH